jgi:hypothetical protein
MLKAVTPFELALSIVDCIPNRLEAELQARAVEADAAFLGVYAREHAAEVLAWVETACIEDGLPEELLLLQEGAALVLVGYR